MLYHDDLTLLRRHFQENGFIESLKKVLKTARDRIKLLVINPPGFYLLAPSRRSTRKLINTYLKPFDKNLITIGNYNLDKKLIKEGMVIYSFGMADDFSFDQELADKYNCQVFCFDPTPLTQTHYDSHYKDNPNIHFTPEAVWTEDGERKFFLINEDENIKKEGSLTNLESNSQFYLVQCRKLESFMKRYDHSFIDIIKLDIEGGALPVLMHMLETSLRPEQIVAEFEKPKENWQTWSKDMDKLLSLFQKNYYLINLKRKGTMYNSIEVLFIKKDTTS